MQEREHFNKEATDWKVKTVRKKRGRDMENKVREMEREKKGEKDNQEGKWMVFNVYYVQRTLYTSLW